MTTLGKILVFVILVFSFVTGALIVTAFVTRTNWKTAHDKLVKELAVVQADRKAWIADVDKIKNEKNGEIEDLKGQLKAAIADRDQIKKQSDDNQKMNALAMERFNQKNTDSQSAASELSRRQMEVTQLHADL